MNYNKQPQAITELGYDVRNIYRAFQDSGFSKSQVTTTNGSRFCTFNFILFARTVRLPHILMLSEKNSSFQIRNRNNIPTARNWTWHGCHEVCGETIWDRNI